jgi:DNA invertase Pin-like site-specific DNA recombinase
MSLHHGTEEGRWYTEKILPRHWERLAVVYVRQSTMQQVLEHQESTRLQYGLVRRAVAWGWPESRVLVIDDDLGRSGTSAEGRHGFQRLVAEVGLDHVGLILGVEMSRLARSSKDWHQLLEICALFGTLIADLDGIYDPSQYNDRLLLGLKGTMSEAELHLLKQRLYQGTLQKARRGALRFALPLGYVHNPAGEVGYDPDAQVQHVVRLIFRKFDELGTLHALLRYLRQHNITVGVRLREGPAKGTLEWRRPNRMTLQNMLKHPLYAGTYAYGRRQVDPRKKQPGRPSTGRVMRPRHAYHAFLKEHVPAYITWAQYERNLARLEANRARAETIGAVRHGPSLLAGLVVCGLCGRRMQVRYGGPNTLHSYTCNRLATDYGGDYCQYLPGEPVDAFVSQWVLTALEPAALALSLEATARLEQERQDLDRLWHQRLERGAYEAERAARHYHLIEPEHRLVARQLAKDWEDALLAQRQLQEDYARFVQAQPPLLSRTEREAIEQLAQNIPALWHAPTTTMAERKEIVRQIIQRVIVAGEGRSERLQITIEWVGGGRTTGLTTRPISRIAHLSDYPRLCERIRTLVQEGCTITQITAVLAHEGFRSPKHARPFSRQSVIELMRRLGVHQPRRHRRLPLQAHEWWLSDLERELGKSNSTLHQWRKRGWLQARWHDQSKRWIAWADAAELQRLKQRSALPAGEVSRQMWLDVQRSHPTGVPPVTEVS